MVLHSDGCSAGQNQYLTTVGFSEARMKYDTSHIVANYEGRLASFGIKENNTDSIIISRWSASLH